MIARALTRNPFPGLRSFEARDEPYFFGRDAQIDAVLLRLQQERFLAIVGTSASGKSSLIRAGVVPALRRGEHQWRIAILRPGEAPLARLAESLVQRDVLGLDGIDAAIQRTLMLTELRRGSLALAEAVQQTRLANDERLVICVDQFEELFRFVRERADDETADEASAFVKLLLAAVRHPAIYVILSMRSDFLGDCDRFRRLPETINDGLFMVPRLTRAQLQEAIEGPIGAMDAEVAPRLVARLLNDVGNDRDQLPLLQHALMRTWDLWSEANGPDRSSNFPAIDLGDYEASGGLREALDRHAEDVYRALGPSSVVAEKLFKSLTERASDNRGIRRPRRFDDACAVTGCLADDVMRVADAFRDQRNSFLMPLGLDEPVLATDSVLDITHESLMRVWKRLGRWVSEEGESAQIYRRLADDASMHAQGATGLVVDPELGRVVKWRDTHHPSPAWAKRYGGAFDQTMEYLAKSIRAQRARARRIWWLLGALFLAVAMASALALFFAEIARDRAKEIQTAHRLEASALRYQRDAERQRNVAQALARKYRRAEQTARQQTTVAVLASLRATEQAKYALRQRLIADGLAGRLKNELRATQAAVEAQTSGAALAFGRHDFERAIAAYDAAIRLRPNNSSAYEGRGIVYLSEGQYQPAIVDFGRALQLSPQFAAAYIERGLAYAAEGSYQRGLADEDAAIRIDRRSWLAYLVRGSVSAMRRDYNGAINDFSRSLALRADPVAYVGRAMLFERVGDVRRSIADLSRAIQMRPSRSFYVKRAHLYVLQHRFDYAVADLTRALSLPPSAPSVKGTWTVDSFTPDSPSSSFNGYTRGYDNGGPDYIPDAGDTNCCDPIWGDTWGDPKGTPRYEEDLVFDESYSDVAKIYDDRADAYLALGNTGLAIADFDRVLGKIPQDRRALIGRASAYERRGEHDRAIRDYTKAIATFGGEVTLLRGRSQAYLQKGSYYPAFADFESIVALAPSAVRDVTRQELYGVAVRDLNRAVALNSESAELYAERGIAHHRLGEDEQGIADDDRVLALRAGDVGALKFRGVAFAREGDYVRALADLNRARALAPNDADTAFVRGVVLFADARFGDAVSDFSAVANDRGDAFGTLWRIVALWRSGARNVNLTDAEVARLRASRSTQILLRIFTGDIKSGVGLAELRRTAPQFKCQASFFVGEYQLTQKNVAEARRLLQETQSDCEKDALERLGAGAELPRIDVTVAPL